MKLIVLDNIKELGNKVNDILTSKYKKDNYIVNVDNSRFSNGEGKINIKESIKDEDIYILCDVGNYSINYKLHNKDHYMSPDEHFQDVKRVISATNGRSEKITLIMPLLYQSRQHKRKDRESLDCALALQELENLGVDNIITFDCHDPNVSNAIPNLPFDNIYPTHTIIKDLIKNEKIDNLLVISPDMGAMQRSKYYAEILGCDVGVFYKRRDLSKVVNGKNPIVDHIYLGADVTDKNIIIVDDMIASGNSMIETAIELKNRGCKNIYLISTFALFTEGVEVFNEAYNKNIFNKLYTTNLSYVDENIKNLDWYHEVDLSSVVADIISIIHEKKSLDNIKNGKKEIIESVKRRLNND